MKCIYLAVNSQVSYGKGQSAVVTGDFIKGTLKVITLLPVNYAEPLVPGGRCVSVGATPAAGPCGVCILRPLSQAGEWCALKC